MRLYLCNNNGDKTLNTLSTLAAIDTESIGKKKRSMFHNAMFTNELYCLIEI